MAALEFTPGARRSLWVGRLVTDVLTHWKEARDARLTRRSLALLSDQQLDDIGVLRSDIGELRPEPFIR